MRCSDQDFEPAPAHPGAPGAEAGPDESERPEGHSEASLHADTNSFLAGMLSSGLSSLGPEPAAMPLRMHGPERISAGEETREGAVGHGEGDLDFESEHLRACPDAGGQDSDAADVVVTGAEGSTVSSSAVPPPPPPPPPVPSVGPEEVLEFWFEGDWQQNFQKKWFTRAVRGVCVFLCVFVYVGIYTYMKEQV